VDPLHNCTVDDVLTIYSASTATPSVITLKDVVIDNSATRTGIYIGQGVANVDIDHSTIDTNGNGIYVEQRTAPQGTMRTITLTNSLVSGNMSGLTSGAGPVTYRLIDTDVSGNSGYGVYLSGAGTSDLIVFEMTGGRLSANGRNGVNINGDSLLDVKVRGVTVTGNKEHGLWLRGGPSAVLDLGTAADPGGNVFQNPGASGKHAGVQSYSPALVNAIGNTWIADHQGADSTGKYAPGPEGYVEFMGPVTTGNNYRLEKAAQVIRL